MTDVTQDISTEFQNKHNTYCAVATVSSLVGIDMGTFKARRRRRHHHHHHQTR